MTFTCPYCNVDSGIELLEEGEVRQSEYDMTIWHVRCVHCNKKFRVIERTETVYNVGRLEA